MPFKSESQRRFMYSQHPELAKEFEAATPEGKHLPEHVPQHMSDGGLMGIVSSIFGTKDKDAIKHDATEASAADAIDPVVSGSTDTAKGYADGGNVDKDEPGLQDATVSDFLLPFMLGKSADVMEGAGSKLADEAGAIFPQKAPAMEDAIAGATTKDVVNPKQVEVYVKGIQKGAPGSEGVKIYGVKGDPATLKEMFGDEAPGSVPENVLQAKGLLPTTTGASAPAPNGYAKGGFPHVTFMEDQTPAEVKKTVHMAEGGTIHKAEDRNKEPAKPRDVEMSHEAKLKSIYRAMGMKKYADGGEVTSSDAIDPSQLPNPATPPSPNDPGFWDSIKAALAQVDKPIAAAMAPAQVAGAAAAPVVQAAAPAAIGAINGLTGASLPVPAANAAPTPPPAPPTPPSAPSAVPTPPSAMTQAPSPTGNPGGLDLKGLFNKDTSALTAGVNPEDRQALANNLQQSQHSLGSTIAQAVAGLGDALATKGGRDQHSLQNIFSMQKDQRQEALANFDQARQDRLQKLDIQTKMGNNALQGLAAQDAYGTDERLNKMLGAPPGTAHKDLPLYFQAKSAAVAQQEKDGDLYMKAHAQAAGDVDNAVKNASVLGVKPSAAQLEASGAKLADNYYNRAKGNILVKPSDGGPSQWIPAPNIQKAKQMDPNLQVIPG